ncbi:hypothetical protein [Rhizobium laguerreae]|uniref:hypothetical protein n=1 Tax=Rhizobium laguerreae TaxID=1076926 RepID=UPI001C905905|nr:hypothetical protein [Rhizobium laguerreae]MBY3369040.1 hypothetical protein [Rhizobium laguerreae]
MHFDASLTRPLLRVRHYLTSIGKEAELDALLELWDASVAKSDFTEMAANFPSFLITLLDLTGETPKAFQIEDDDDVRYALELLRRAIAGTDHQSLCATDSAFLEDTSGDLGGLLEELLCFNEPDAYVIERNWPGWRSETVDFDELTGNDPILLSDFVSGVDGFVSNLITARRNWKRWRGRDNSIPSVS